MVVAGQNMKHKLMHELFQAKPDDDMLCSVTRKVLGTVCYGLCRQSFLP